MELDAMGTVKAAAYLGIHRSTLLRLSSSGALPPDGHSSGNRPIWYRGTLDRYRLGVSRKAVVFYVLNDHLPELSVALEVGGSVLGMNSAPLTLDGADRISCVTSLLQKLASDRPTVLALPAKGTSMSLNATVVELCDCTGTSILLVNA